LEAAEAYSNLVNFQQYCLAYREGDKKLIIKKYPTLAEYGLDIDFLNEYNQIKRYKFSGMLAEFGDERQSGALIAFFTKYLIKNNIVQPDIDEAKGDLDIAEEILNAKIEYVNLIPPDYRFPLALNEMYSYLLNGRAESWKEAINLFEETLHRWKLEQDSEEAMLLQAQTAALAGRAASSAGAAALFSELRLFFR